MVFISAITAFFKTVGSLLGLVRDSRLVQSGVDKANLTALMARVRRRRTADDARRDSDATGGRLRDEDFRD